MSKLSFEELKKKAKEVEIKELMESISGGTENACHDDDVQRKKEQEERYRWIERQRRYPCRG